MPTAFEKTLLLLLLPPIFIGDYIKVMPTAFFQSKTIRDKF